MSIPDRIRVWVCETCRDWQRDPGPCRNVCGTQTKAHLYSLYAETVARALRQAA